MNKRLLRTLFLAVALVCLPLLAEAQQCVINGRMGKDSLRFTKSRIEKVYLSGLNEFDQFVRVDSAVVSGGTFSFTRPLKSGSPLLMYFITGFDNGEVPVWVEQWSSRLLWSGRQGSCRTRCR